jgi:glycosyltransferase involved in cell wall biosynthesis
MLWTCYAMLLLALAALPALLFVRNLPLFRRVSTQTNDSSDIGLSILIPARNEESGIEQSLRSILANSFHNFEILVLDDASTDQTARIVQRMAELDPRIRLLSSAELPTGWNGKQHACWQLAQAATRDIFLFLDADVRLSADALVRIANECQQSPRDLLSGFPFQVTVSVTEQLLLPMMHVILLGYLPLDQMRTSRKPEFGAGCGQLFIANREAYFKSGGHASIRSSRHDGLKLPRAFRSAQLLTDVFDASDIATCRMYHSASQVVHGLLKNATEGIAQPKLIGLFTVLLVGGQSLPLLSWGHAIYHGWPWLATWILGLATLLSFLPRALAAMRFGQSWLGVLLHPLAVLLFVGLQWWAFLRQRLGIRPVAWRGRAN